MPSGRARRPRRPVLLNQVDEEAQPRWLVSALRRLKVWKWPESAYPGESSCQTIATRPTEAGSKTATLP